MNAEHCILLEAKDVVGGKFADIFKYVDDDDVYVSFTRVANKAGLNPKSEFDTPIGIYCYQLRRAVNVYNVRPEANNFPFAGDRKYINVMKSNTHIKTMRSDEYSRSDFLADLHILEAWAQSNEDDKIGQLLHLHLKQAIANSATKSKVETNMGQMWYVLWYVSKFAKDKGMKSSIAWTFLLHKILKYDLIRDEGDGIIHSNEPCQSVFFSTKSFRVIDILVNQDTGGSTYTNRSIYGTKRILHLLNKLISAKNTTGINKTLNMLDQLSRKYGKDEFVRESFSEWASKIIDSKSQEDVKFLISSMGPDRFLSQINHALVMTNLQDSGRRGEDKVRNVLLTLINDIDVHHLETLVGYKLPLHVLIKRYGSNTIKQYITYDMFRDLLFSHDKLMFGGRNINALRDLYGPDSFEKRIESLMDGSTYNTMRMLNSLIHIDVLKMGRNLRGPHKVESLLDLVGDKFKRQIAKIIIEYPDRVYSILVNGWHKLYGHRDNWDGKSGTSTSNENLLNMLSKLKPYIADDHMVKCLKLLYEQMLRYRHFGTANSYLNMLLRRGVLRQRPTEYMFGEPPYWLLPIDVDEWDLSKL